jgi:hypothetical protein
MMICRSAFAFYTSGATLFVTRLRDDSELSEWHLCLFKRYLQFLRKADVKVNSSGPKNENCLIVFV